MFYSHYIGLCFFVVIIAPGGRTAVYVSIRIYCESRVPHWRIPFRLCVCTLAALDHWPNSSIRKNYTPAVYSRMATVLCGFCVYVSNLANDRLLSYINIILFNSANVAGPDAPLTSIYLVVVVYHRATLEEFARADHPRYLWYITICVSIWPPYRGILAAVVNVPF